MNSTVAKVFGKAVRAAWTELSSEEAVSAYAQWGASVGSTAITAAVWIGLVALDSVPKFVAATQVATEIGIGLYHWAVNQFNDSEIAAISEQLLLPAEKVKVIEDISDYEPDDLFWFEPSDHEQFTSEPSIITPIQDEEVPEQPVIPGIRQLRLHVKAAGIKGYSRMTKAQCLEALEKV